MLQKKYRLRKNSAFTATYKQKKILSDMYVTAYIGREKKDKDHPSGFAFVVSKKIHKRAVIRNRIKRLMRENIRLFLKNDDFPVLNNYMSVIFVAKSASVNASFTDINASLKSLISLIK